MGMMDKFRSFMGMPDEDDEDDEPESKVEEVKIQDDSAETE